MGKGTGKDRRQQSVGNVSMVYHGPIRREEQDPGYAQFGEGGSNG